MTASPPVPFSELYERVDDALDRWFSGPRGSLPEVDGGGGGGGGDRAPGAALRVFLALDDAARGRRPVEDRRGFKHGVAEVTIPLSAGSKKDSVRITPIGG